MFYDIQNKQDVHFNGDSSVVLHIKDSLSKHRLLVPKHISIYSVMPTFAEDNEENLCLYCTQIIGPNQIWLGGNICVCHESSGTGAKAGTETIIYIISEYCSI